MNLDGRVAIITGGTAGIGEATVRRMAGLGARVVIVGRDQRRGESLERDLLRQGSEVVFLKADVARPEEAPKDCAVLRWILSDDWITHSIMRAPPVRTASSSTRANKTLTRCLP
jgi:short-subunit dehydrogenase involved in D-alanine esterification of teichoic acids